MSDNSGQDNCLARLSSNRNISVIFEISGVGGRWGINSEGPGRSQDLHCIHLAERVGFEPTDHLTEVNALAGRPIRPLWHLSERREVYLEPDVLTQTHPDNLTDGTVAEWTIAPALKAGGRKARGFESLPFRS